MALTLPRWIAALVIGALIAAVILLTSRRPEPRQRESAGFALLQKYRRADGIAGRSARRLRTFQIADSVTASLSKLPQTNASRAVFGRGLEPSLPFLRTAVDHMAPNRPRAAVAPIDLALVLGKPVMIQGHEVASGWNYDRTVILPRTAAERCVAIMNLGGVFGKQIMTEEYAWMRRRTSRRLQSAEALGPCGFYEAFGAPGPQIDQWLRAGAWRLGMAGTVSTADKNTVRVDSALLSPWLPWNEADFRLQFTTTGYRCITGDAASCASVVLSPTADSDANLTLGTRVAENGVLERWAGSSEYWASGNLGQPQQWVLADMIRMLGRERFQRFWTSDKAPAEAFEAAFGLDIGAWTVEWAQSWYGVRGRGPAVSSSSALVAGLVVLLSIVSAIGAARRQQVVA